MEQGGRRRAGELVTRRDGRMGGGGLVGGTGLGAGRRASNVSCRDLSQSISTSNKTAAGKSDSEILGEWDAL